MADRKYVAVSVKHTEHGWKFGMPMVLWGRKRTADNEKRCFSGYTTYLNNAELYALGDFEKEGYWQDWIKDDAPLKLCVGFCKKYKEYEREAAWFLKPMPPRPIECRVNIRCLFYLPTRRRTDLTNLLEAVDDLLVHAGIIADDHYGIVEAHDGSRCFVDRDNPRTEITITRIIEPAQDVQMRMEGIK